MGIFKTEIEKSIKIISIFIFSFFISFQREIEYFDILFILFILITQKIEYQKLSIKILKLNIFILFTSLTVILSEADFEFAKLIFIRSNLILIFSITLMQNMDSFKIFRAIYNLNLPKKIAFTLFFTIKYIEILQSEAEKILIVLKIKNFESKMDKLTLQTYGFLFASLIIKTIKKSQILSENLKLRMHQNRFFIKERIQLSKIDYFILISLTIRIFYELYLNY